MSGEIDPALAGSFRLVASEIGPAGGRFTVEVVPDGPFFDGHFPGAPILPAVAQLVLVEALHRHVAGSQVSIVGIENLRLLRPVSPAMVIDVHLEHEGGDDASLQFEILGTHGPLSRGRLLRRPASPA